MRRKTVKCKKEIIHLWGKTNLLEIHKKYKLQDNESYMNEINIKQLESVTEERSSPHHPHC